MNTENTLKDTVIGLSQGLDTIVENGEANYEVISVNKRHIDGINDELYKLVTVVDNLENENTRLKAMLAKYADMEEWEVEYNLTK